MNTSIKSTVPPVIVMGMHRSGTTIVTEVLKQLGLFVGNDLEPNNESWLFIKHNSWLLGQCGGAWHNPAAVHWLLDNAKVVGLAEEYIRYRFQHWPASRYLGAKRYFSGQRLLPGLSSPWGWKDPRNTFTLPFWLRLYPNARIVYVYRNGVPVAASLRERDRRGLNRFEILHHKRLKSGIYAWQAKKGGFVNSVRCLTLEGAFSLWEEYVDHAEMLLPRISQPLHTIRYEDYVDEPERHLEKLAEFCHLSVSKKIIGELSKKVDPSRAKAFMEDSELAGFYTSVKNRRLMKEMGYS